MTPHDNAIFHRIVDFTRNRSLKQERVRILIGGEFLRELPLLLRTAAPPIITEHRYEELSTLELVDLPGHLAMRELMELAMQWGVQESRDGEFWKLHKVKDDLIAALYDRRVEVRERERLSQARVHAERLQQLEARVAAQEEGRAEDRAREDRSKRRNSHLSPLLVRGLSETDAECEAPPVPLGRRASLEGGRILVADVLYGQQSSSQTSPASLITAPSAQLSILPPVVTTASSPLGDFHHHPEVSSSTATASAAATRFFSDHPPPIPLTSNFLESLGNGARQLDGHPSQPSSIAPPPSNTPTNILSSHMLGGDSVEEKYSFGLDRAAEKSMLEELDARKERLRLVGGAKWEDSARPLIQVELLVRPEDLVKKKEALEEMEYAARRRCIENPHRTPLYSPIQKLQQKQQQPSRKQRQQHQEEHPKLPTSPLLSSSVSPTPQRSPPHRKNMGGNGKKMAPKNPKYPPFPSAGPAFLSSVLARARVDLATAGVGGAAPLPPPPVLNRDSAPFLRSLGLEASADTVPALPEHLQPTALPVWGDQMFTPEHYGVKQGDPRWVDSRSRLDALKKAQEKRLRSERLDKAYGW